MKLGVILRKWRINSELKQKDVAASIGIPERVLGRIEAGESMDGETLARVLHWLTTSWSVAQLDKAYPGVDEGANNGAAIAEKE